MAFASDESCVRRLAWYERTRPTSRAALAESLREPLEALSADHVGRRATEQLLAARCAELAHEVLFSIQVTGGEDDDASLEAVRTEAGRLLDELACLEVVAAQLVGGRSTAVPSARELAAMIRDSLDPWGAVERERPPRFADPGVPAQRFGPHARDVGWSHGSISVTGHLLEMPRRDTDATFLRGLLTAGETARTVAFVMRVFGPQAGTRRAERHAEEGSAESWLRAKIGRRSSERHRSEESHVALRERELAEGHALVSFAGFVSVAVPEAAGVQEAQRQFDRMQARCLQSGLRLERMRGEQLDALTYTLPLCRGLR